MRGMQETQFYISYHNTKQHNTVQRNSIQIPLKLLSQIAENRVAIESERAQKQFSRVQEMEEEVLLVCQERDDATRACKNTTGE